MQAKVHSSETSASQIHSSNPIMLVLPRNNQRNALIAHLLHDLPSAYYALTEQEQTFSGMTAHILEALREQGLGQATLRANASDEKAGQALGTALANANIEVLVLDHFDLLDADPSEWVRGLLQTLPKAVHLVISSRRLDSGYWNPLIKSGAAGILGDITRIGGSVLDGEPDRLEVYALGRGAVWFEGRSVTRWDGPLTRRLFYFLLDRGPVSRMTIFETFWPTLPVREATNVFHVTKRKMNETIGRDVTDYADRHYLVSGKAHLHYDVAAFQAAAHEADMAISDEQSISAWQRAIELYRHPFLMEETTPWVVARRTELREQYAQALIGMARAYQRQHEVDLALSYYLRALRELPVREDLHTQVMKLHAERGDKQAAIAQYLQLQQRLSDSLGITPAREVTRLYTRLTH